jgi:hypothetical protein
VDHEAVVTGQEQVVRTRAFSITTRDVVALQRRTLVSRLGLAVSRRQLAVYAVIVPLAVVMALTGSPTPLILGAAAWVLAIVYCMTLLPLVRHTYRYQPRWLIGLGSTLLLCAKGSNAGVRSPWPNFGHAGRSQAGLSFCSTASTKAPLVLVYSS